jgi:hypothetical protein
MMPGQMKKRALPAASGRNHQHIGVCPLKISDARPDSKGSTDLIDMFLSSINRALSAEEAPVEVGNLRTELSDRIDGGTNLPQGWAPPG